MSSPTAKTSYEQRTSSNLLHTQRRLATKRILQQTHWTFDQSLKTRVNQKRHEHHKLQEEHVQNSSHQRTHKKRSSNERSVSDPVKNATKSNDEQESEHEKEHIKKEEPQFSTQVENEAYGSHLGPSSKCNAASHDDATQYHLSSRILEIKQTIRDALVFGKRYLNRGRKLNKADNVSVAKDRNSETEENEIPLFTATAQYNESRFQDYNKQMDDEIQQWIRQHGNNAHITSSHALIGCEESRQTASEGYENLREHRIANDSQAASEEDDSWMDEYRNPLFDEYNGASSSISLPATNPDLHNTSKAGMDLDVDESHDADIQSRNRVDLGSHETQKAQDFEPLLDSNESGLVAAEAVRTMSISRIKFLQDLMLQAMEQFQKDKRFRANPVPPATSEPRYDDLMMEQDLRRFINKHEAMELLQQLQKPFSFDSRMQHTRPQIPVNKAPYKTQSFIAKEVPYHVKQMRYTLMLEQEASRKAEIQKQAKLKLESAKQPPRMELHQRGSQMKTAPTLGQAEEEMKNRSAGFIPDFKSLHSQWKKRLQRSRASNQRKLTVPLAFNMERRPNRRSSVNQSSNTPTLKPCTPNKRLTTNKGLRNSSPKNKPDIIQEKKAMSNEPKHHEYDSKKKTKTNKEKRSNVPRTETETPSQYVKARYKQIETQAKEIVAEALKAQGLDFHKYITF